VEQDDGRWWACERCGALLGATSENFKWSTLVRESELHEVDAAVYPRVADFCDDAVVLRSYFCPSCGAQLSVDVCRQTDGHLWDYKLI
jgi:acetone carboxylase gamma subunit